MAYELLSKFSYLAKIERKLWLSKKEEVYFYAPTSIWYIAATQTDNLKKSK